MSPPERARLARPALTVNQAPPEVLVRLHDGALVGSVPEAFAAELLTTGAAARVGRDRVRYLKLARDIHIERTVTGWAMIERQRHFHGDKAVCNAAIRFDHQALRWAAPAKRELKPAEEAL